MKIASTYLDSSVSTRARAAKVFAFLFAWREVIFISFARLEFLRETCDIEKFLELSLTSRELNIRYMNSIDMLISADYAMHVKKV